MRASILVIPLLFLTASRAFGQFAVHDAAVTTRNAASAVLKEYILSTQREQHTRLRQMAQRLSVLTNLQKYSVPRAILDGGLAMSCLARLKRVLRGKVSDDVGRELEFRTRPTRCRHSCRKWSLMPKCL